MLVRLKNNWFSPEGKLYKSIHGPQEIPDRLKDKLPPSAQVAGEEKKKEGAKLPSLPAKTELEKMKGDDLRRLATERNVKLEAADTNAVIIEKLLK